MRINRLVDTKTKEAWEICSDRELHEAVLARLRTMRASQSIVLHLHYGLGNQDGIRYSIFEISQIRKRGYSSIRQILQMALDSISRNPKQLLEHAKDRGLVSLQGN
jgi:hypothetical protein